MEPPKFELEPGAILTPTPMADHERGAQGYTADYRDGWNAACKEAMECAVKMANTTQCAISYYDGILEGQRALVRELDVGLNGADAAPQAALVDLVVMAQSKRHNPQKSLEDVRLYVASHMKHFTPEQGAALLRFCKEGGATGQVFRKPVAPATPT